MSNKKEIPKRGGGRPAIYPWRELEIGDSFFVGGLRHGEISGALRYASVRHGMKFAARVDQKNGVKGLRIYRTK